MSANATSECSDLEAEALSSLLDAFPSVPLETIAYAFTQANGDLDLSAEIISLSINGFPSIPDVDRNTNIGSSGRGANGTKAGECAKTFSDEFVKVPNSIRVNGSAKAVYDEFVEVPALRLEGTANINLASTSKDSTSAVTRTVTNVPKNLNGLGSRGVSIGNLPCGPSPPILKEYFPSDGKKNAWEVPLNKILMKNAHDKQQSLLHPTNDHEHRASDLLLEFPKLEITSASRSPKPAEQKGSINQKVRLHRTKAAGYACGLVSDVRKKHFEDHMCKRPTDIRNAELNKCKTVNLSESEAHILSILEGQVNTDIETVRDVLDNCGGDVAKSIEVLLEIGSASIDYSSAVDSDMELITDGKGSNCPQWVIESLCGQYPPADKATVLEVLHASDCNNAKARLEDAFLSNSTSSKEKIDDQELSSASSGPGELSKMILESFFSNHSDEQEEMERQSGNINEKEKREVPEGFEIPEWNVVTRATVDNPSDGEVNEKMKRRCPNDSATYGDWNDYDRHWSSAVQHLKTMENYLAAARKAYEAGDKSKGAVLEEKANVYRQLSREAKERANIQMLQREKEQHNDDDFVVDLREHNLSDGLRTLRLHIKSFSRIPSCSVFRVLTGWSKNNKSRNMNLRDEVVKYVEEKGHEWVEPDPFCIEVRLKK